VVSPPRLKHCYSEHLLRLPHSYFVNDYARTCPEGLEESNRPTRESVGLPPGAVVFSCSNQLYKIDPAIFDTWCAILRRVPSAVLWLLRFPPFGEARLRAEAAKRGVAPERLIFSDVAANQVRALSLSACMPHAGADDIKCARSCTSCAAAWQTYSLTRRW
jgi:protein O-GlcNAc transferase